VADRLRSRKLWVAVVGAAVVALADQLGLDRAAAEQVVMLAAAYLIGQGVADAGRDLFGKLKKQ